MADDSIEYAIKTRFGGDDELRRAANTVDRFGQGVKRALDFDSVARRAEMRWTELSSAVQLAERAVGAIKNVAAGAYAALGEGANLLAAEGRFENLAGSINSTADALLGRMREATNGMMSDAQLIASATDIISLGLAKNEDSAVRLSAVVGKLGWDMQVVTLTMANNSKMRLDSLGLSMEDVTARAKKLEEAGLSMDAAFDLAVIEAGEAKIQLLGDASETAAGKIAKIQAVVANVENEFKTAFAAGVAGALGAATDQAELLNEALALTGQQAGDLLGRLGGTAGFQFANEAASRRLREMGADMGALERQAVDLRREMGAGVFQLGFDPRDVEYQAELFKLLAAEMERLQNLARASDPKLDRWIPPAKDAAFALNTATDAMTRFTQASNQMAYDPVPIQNLAEGYWVYESSIRETNQALIDQAGYAADVRDEWAQMTAELTATGGDIFTSFIEDADAAREAGRQWAYDLNQAIYDAANLQGAGAGFLSDFAADLGIAVQDIDKALSATQQQAIVDSLAAGVREYGIAWSELPGMVDAAIAELEGRTEQVARALPSPEDRGFREGWAEAFNAVPKETVKVPLEVQLREDLIQTAIDNARGMVEGFTNPDEVYQAVMEMDISAVETGSARATQIINGIPTSRTITINWEQSGTDVIAALRALGVLP